MYQEILEKWKKSLHLDSVGRDNNDPQIALDVAGNSYIVWQGNDGNDNEIYWSKIDALGNPGQVEKISTYPDNQEIHDFCPQIAVDSSGNSYVVWEGNDGNYSQIYWVKVDASGNPGQVEKISTHPDNEGNDNDYAHIAVDITGDSYVTWRGWHGSDKISEIYWAKVDKLGNPGEVRRISADSHSKSNYGIPQIVVDGTGNSCVVWEGNDGNYSQIYWVKVDSSGNPGQVEKISTHPDNEGNDNYCPQIAVDASGNTYVVWEGCYGGSCWNAVGNYEIYWVKIEASGNPGEVEKISTHPENEGNNDHYPQIAVDASGNSNVVWYCWDNHHDFEIYWVKVGSSGNPGQVEKISTYRGHQIYWDQDPHIAIDASGNSYIIWEAGQPDHDTYSAYDIYWIRMDVLGNCSRIMKIYSCFLV
jgi:hypothetical protein